jgi:hypothetical protein
MSTNRIHHLGAAGLVVATSLLLVAGSARWLDGGCDRHVRGQRERGLAGPREHPR